MFKKRIYKEQKKFLFPNKNSNSIKVIFKNTENKKLPINEIEKIFNFNYTDRLFASSKTLYKAIKYSKVINLDNSWENTFIDSKIRSSYSKDLYIKYINKIIGYGAFANEVIEKGSFITEYTGKLITKLSTFFTKNKYLWDYSSPQKNSPLLIDAKKYGNIARFINHNYNPNTKAKFFLSEGLMHICIFSTKKINIGEELTYDYGPKYWKNRTPPIINY